MAATTRYGTNGYWTDRMGFKTSGVSLVGINDFNKAKTFLDALAVFTNMKLLRYNHSATTTERATGGATQTGHFDLAGYVARLVFYNYKAEDSGDSPNISLTIPAPHGNMLTETKDGIWVVTEAAGQTIAQQIATALDASGQIEFIRGEVPEN